MSLRLRLLAAFAYGFLLILVALEVPLALNLARRVDAEVKNDAAGQAHIVAAQASGSMNDGSQLRRIARRAATELGARVIIVNGAGVLRADSADGAVRSYASRPEIRTALAGSTSQGKRHSATLGENLLFTARDRGLVLDEQNCAFSLHVHGDCAQLGMSRSGPDGGGAASRARRLGDETFVGGSRGASSRRRRLRRRARSCRSLGRSCRGVCPSRRRRRLGRGCGDRPRREVGHPPRRCTEDRSRARLRRRGR